MDEASSLQAWLSTFTFSRSVRHAARDFSDAVLMAELLAQLLPTGTVAIHNYPSTGRFQQKLTNWEMLNRKILTPMRCELSPKLMEDLANAAPGAIALVLIRVKQAVQQGEKKPPLSPRKTISTKRLAEPNLQPSPSRASVPKPTSDSFHSPIRTRPTSAGGKKQADYRRSSSDTGPRDTLTKQSLNRSPRASSKQTDDLKSSSESNKLSHSRFSLKDYLPSPNERPDPDALGSTFVRVLELTEVGKSPRRDSKKISPRSLQHQQGNNRTFSLSAKRLNNSLSFKTDLPAHRRLSHGEPSDPASLRCEIPEGSFVQMSYSGVEEDDDRQIARVVETRQSGDCLIQLFKPIPNDELYRRYSSTPHFVECCSSQLNLIPDMNYDPASSSWIQKHGSAKPCFRREWPVSPTHRKPESPPHHYSTTVLNRVKLTGVGDQGPLDILPVKSPEILSAKAFEVDVEQLELCPKPTVFSPVKVDVNEILANPPPRFPVSPNKRRN